MYMFIVGSCVSEVRGSKVRSSVNLQMSLRAMLAAWGGCPTAHFVLVVANNMKMVISAGSSLDCSSPDRKNRSKPVQTA